MIKLPAEGTTKIHVRFTGGKTETLTTLNPKSSAQQVKTQPKVVELVDKLLDDHIYSEIAEVLNQKGDCVPAVRRDQGRADVHSPTCASLISSIEYGLRSRYDRLREPRHADESRGVSSASEICESTLDEMGQTRPRRKTRLQRPSLSL